MFIGTRDEKMVHCNENGPDKLQKAKENDVRMNPSRPSKAPTKGGGTLFSTLVVGPEGGASIWGGVRYLGGGGLLFGGGVYTCRWVWLHHLAGTCVVMPNVHLATQLLSCVLSHRPPTAQ